MNHPLMNDQIALEEEMRGATRARYFRIHDKEEARGAFGDTHAARSIVDHYLPLFIEGIYAWMKDREDGRPGPRSRALILLREFGDIETAAFLFLKGILSKAGRGYSMAKSNRSTKTSSVLYGAMSIHDEMRLRFFAGQQKALMRAMVEDFKKRELPRLRRREMFVRVMNQHKIEWQAPGWGQSERLNLGIVLFEILKATTGLVTEYSVFEGKREVFCITLTQHASEALAAQMDHAADLFTVFYPTIVPPRPWTNDALLGGGYYTDYVTPYRLIKRSSIKFLCELENRDMSKVLEPINALQNTAWRVNSRIVDVLEHVFSHDIPVSNLPPSSPKPIPDPPPGIDVIEEVTKDYRRTCYMIHDENRRMISKRVSVLTTISLARRFEKYPAIYFPHDMDSRGRAYPKVPFLNPQGTDYVKGILEFSEGKPVTTPTQQAYIAIAVANSWGQDKAHLRDRIQWVVDNEAMLFEVADNPTKVLTWAREGDPFMALRAAMEWADMRRHGTGFVSHMPIHFDATCSGLQHYSALLLDEVGGYHVNLTPSKERQDIYSEVAEKATASLSLLDCDESRLALHIGITRAMCKRPVMIVPYAGTFSACMSYIGEHLVEIERSGVALPEMSIATRRSMIALIARHVWDAISSTVILARAAMDWITTLARSVSKGQSAPIQWETPDGLLVRQARYKMTSKAIETYLDGGRRIQTRMQTETDKLCPRQMSQSLPPNFIHSLDACHMRMTILRALELEKGMSFAAIHDSFGVHAADMEEFVEECIKPSFITMYDDTRLLEKFHEDVTFNLTEEQKADLPVLPSLGALDIHEVQESEFFFS